MSLDISLGNALKRLDEKSRRFGRMDTDYDQDGQYSDYDDTGIYTDDYDDEVFATLNC